MKSTKRLIALLLCVCMMLGVIPTGAIAAESNRLFQDVGASSWYHDDVSYVYENGIMNGVGNGEFALLEDTARGMVATVIPQSSPKRISSECKS